MYTNDIDAAWQGNQEIPGSATHVATRRVGVSGHVKKGRHTQS